MKKLADFINEALIKEQSRNKKRRIEKNAIAAIQGKKSSIKNPIKTIVILTPDFPDSDNADYSSDPKDPEVRKANKRARKSLNEYLKQAHYVWKPVTGKYRNVVEQTVMIFNMSLQHGIDLAKQYNQSSMIFVKVHGGGKATYEYWEKANGFKSASKTVNDDIEIVTDDNDLFTRISKRFKFRIPFTFESCEKRIAEIIESRLCIKDADDAEYRIRQSMNANPSTRYYASIMLYGDVSEI